MSLKNTCLDYFYKFASKDLDGLISMFCGTYIDELFDWNQKEIGIDNVRNAYERLFSNIDNIRVIPLKMIEEDNTVCCQIKIIINNKDILDVIDVIEFSDGKILKIKAYKC